jgi:predicted DNA-binding transcriptional regulator YafY
MIVGWCELREAFRTFRTDRVVDAAFLEDRHGQRPGQLRVRWQKHLEAERAAWKKSEPVALGEGLK